MLAMHPSKWTVQQVSTFLAENDLPPQIITIFQKNDVDGSVLIKLTDDKLKIGLEIASFGFREKILVALELLKQQYASPSIVHSNYDTWTPMAEPLRLIPIGRIHAPSVVDTPAITEPTQLRFMGDKAIRVKDVLDAGDAQYDRGTFCMRGVQGSILYAHYMHV
jgi:hypothetical protein